jgi:hypothetical protein
MLDALPIRNCIYFLAPTSLDHWRGYDVPGVVGVLWRDIDGRYHVLDAFQVVKVPDAKELQQDVRFEEWVNRSGGRDQIRFDVFMMPSASMSRRQDVVTLLQRSCGFDQQNYPEYAHAV